MAELRVQKEAREGYTLSRDDVEQVETGDTCRHMQGQGEKTDCHDIWRYSDRYFSVPPLLGGTEIIQHHFSFQLQSVPYPQ